MTAKRLLALPLLLVALALQALAPGAAARAEARALDPFSNLPICASGHMGGERGPSAPADRHGGACAACVLCTGPAPALLPEFTLAQPLASCEAAAGVTADLPGPGAPAIESARARGPPDIA